jgi:ribosomal protein L37AE/L43A
MEHTASDTSPLTCPFCEASTLANFGRNSARCDACGGVLGGDFLESLRRIVALPDTVGRHACECGHPEMRLLPDNVYRCPACGSEVLPLSAANVSWISPGRSEAYRQGWLDGAASEERSSSLRAGSSPAGVPPTTAWTSTADTAPGAKPGSAGIAS